MGLRGYTCTSPLSTPKGKCSNLSKYNYVNVSYRHLCTDVLSSVFVSCDFRVLTCKFYILQFRFLCSVIYLIA